MVNTEDSALLVIDVQELYFNRGCSKGKYDEGLVNRINDIIRTSNKKNEKIIYIKNIGKLNGKEYASEFCDELDVINNLIFYKSKSDSFSNLYFEKFIKDNNIKNISCVGLDGNFCVAATAIAAAKRGINTKIILSGIGIGNKERFVLTRMKLENAGVLLGE